MVARAIVLAAPASGSGKTTIATGLIGALREAGHRVAPFKVGPDYIDPGYHTLAAGRPGRNLDPVLIGEDRILPLFAHGARGTDIAVVEGVMGLFDGRIDSSDSEPAAFGSAAHVARLLGAPVVMVIDARGHSQSLAAVLHGFVSFDSRIRIAGVILNQVGSPRHEQVLRQACSRVGLPVLGALPRISELHVPSRHLGLIPAAEHGAEAMAAVHAMVAIARKHLDLASIARIAQEVPDVSAEFSVLTTENPARSRIAVAGGRAFTFGYAEHREILEAQGAEVVTFDPLADSLPDGTQGIVLPGGFPEQHAADLAQNTPLLSQIRDAAASGMPVHAECAGLLYLCRTLDGVPMAGVLDADATFTPRLTLGYRDAVAVSESPLWPAGSRVAGHEFHRSTVTPAAGMTSAWGWRTENGSAVEGFVHGNVHASFLHTHPVGNPEGVRRFAESASRHHRW
ncbi:MAG: cobyrinate a,c-diamide synthase [Nocardiaceae bacterium]|nr:cobyrinate a,c-diamide synthase [Nocardiaceae bacterium]